MSSKEPPKEILGSDGIKALMGYCDRFKEGGFVKSGGNFYYVPTEKALSRISSIDVSNPESLRMVRATLREYYETAMICAVSAYADLDHLPGYCREKGDKHASCRVWKDDSIFIAWDIHPVLSHRRKAPNGNP